MHHHNTAERTYESAITIINSRRRQSRPDHAASSDRQVSNMPSSSGTADLKGTPSITGMSEWLQMLGYTTRDINGLNIIHIAGTKGKGSTCAFAESFLRAHGRRTGYPLKTGMYTSPHLILPEERIRINSEPLDRSLFARYFFEVYDKLPQLALPYDPTKSIVERGPRFLQLYALLAFHVFIQEKVDVTILETHNGGEYDATNVVQMPVVTAITTLGLDHVEMLGPTIQNIAWHKAGICKPGAVAVSTLQDAAPAQVLEAKALESRLKMRFVDQDDRLPIDAVQLMPSVQRKNAALALAAAGAFLSAKAPIESRDLVKEDIEAGVEQWSWPGRFQIIPDGPRTWFLDAAHNDMSVKIAAEWFAEMGAELEHSPAQILVFSHISELRDAIGLLRSLATALKANRVNIWHVIFSTYTESDEAKSVVPAEELDSFHEVWTETFPNSTIWNEPTVQGAIRRVKTISEGSSSSVQTLVTGSQHLVGPALRILQTG